MIQIEKNGSEARMKLEEIESLRKSAEVRTAQRMLQVDGILDSEIRMLRKQYLEGLSLISSGVTLEALDAILRKFCGGVDYDG